MRTSAAGLALIKTFEGLRETAVRLPDGRWTIGYGHVRTAREGLTISAKDAEDLLVLDLKPVEAAVTALIYAPLMQNQFDALVSLAYNISLGQFRDSRIVAHLNGGNYLAAANGFDLWRKARLNGRLMIVDALVRRRAAEKAMFLDHPSGPPSAPTPLVIPEIDVPGAEAPRPRGSAPERDDDYPEAPASTPGAQDSEIAKAVQRLAESMQTAVRPAQEIPLPPGAVVAADKPTETVTRVETIVETVTQTTDAMEGTEETSDMEPQHRDPAVTAEHIARASRTVAERVSRILNVAETTIRTHEADAEPRQARPNVREGLPDFDKPAERFKAEAANANRRLIDDTEVLDTGRDPARLFADAERKAKVVNGNSRRVGPLSGRLLALTPWFVVLALSVVGFIVGTVEAFRESAMADGGPRFAATVLAVFGVMTVMSLYFIFWKRTSEEA